MELADLAAPPVTEIVASQSASTAFVDSVIVAESGGNPNARPCDPATGKPRSSAYGAGQFIEATWLEMVRKYRPDLAVKTDDELLALRADFKVSRQMAVHYTEQNLEYLRKKGLKTTQGALYLAHFAGPTGAARLLSAEPDEPVEEILSEGALKANPFLEGKTAAGVYAWASKKMKEHAAAKPVVMAKASVTDYSAVPECSAAAAADRLATAPVAAEPTSAPSMTQKVRMALAGVAKMVTNG